MIYTLTTAIKAVLEGIDQIKQVYAYPVGEDTSIEKYPAAIFLQDSFDNAFEDTTANMKQYRFKVWIVIGCEASTMEKVFADALPKTVDAVLAAFDAAWDGGQVGGHRVRWLITAGATTLAQTQNSREAVAELTLHIKALTG